MLYYFAVIFTHTACNRCTTSYRAATCTVEMQNIVIFETIIRLIFFQVGFYYMIYMIIILIVVVVVLVVVVGKVIVGTIVFYFYKLT